MNQPLATGGVPPAAALLRRRLNRLAVTGLAILGVLLLAASTIIELSNVHPRAELATGIAAGAAFLLAMAFSRGGDARANDRRARFLVGAGLSALLAVAALWQTTERSAPRVLLLLIPVCLLFTTAALALHEAANQRRNAHLREVRARLDGEEAERRRWVRELHDDTLQELAAVMVVLGAAVTSDDPAARTRGIADAKEVVGRQIRALRRLVAQMRPLALDTLGLDAALEDLARHAREGTDIDISVTGRDLPRLPADTETSLYRIVQEALTNAVRHSGAQHITIDTSAHPTGLEITVRDDGHGHPSGFAHGHGIIGMQERADTLRAHLHITGAAEHGTVVHLRLPYPGPAPPARPVAGIAPPRRRGQGA